MSLLAMHEVREKPGQKERKEVAAVAHLPSAVNELARKMLTTCLRRQVLPDIFRVLRVSLPFERS